MVVKIAIFLAYLEITLGSVRSSTIYPKTNVTQELMGLYRVRHSPYYMVIITGKRGFLFTGSLTCKINQMVGVAKGNGTNAVAILFWEESCCQRVTFTGLYVKEVTHVTRFASVRGENDNRLVGSHTTLPKEENE
jgi:hypothetical protein